MKLNSTPLRRIAQAFVIATKTKIDISGLKIPEHIDDAYFRRFNSKKAPKKGDANIFTQGTTVSLNSYFLDLFFFSFFLMIISSLAISNSFFFVLF